MHELLCYTRLLKSKALPQETHQMLTERLTPHVLKVVARTPGEWKAYGLKPLHVAESPQDEFASLLADPIERQLNFEIEEQGTDGAWSPEWSWGRLLSQRMPKAEILWKSWLTLNNLRFLKAYDRLEK